MKKQILVSAIIMMSMVSFVKAEEATPEAGKKPAMMTPSKEDREKMAKAHEQMAACLRSEQDMKSCMDALHSECKATMGDSCPAMGPGMGKGRGMRHKK